MTIPDSTSSSEAENADIRAENERLCGRNWRPENDPANAHTDGWRVRGREEHPPVGMDSRRGGRVFIWK